MNAGSDTVYGFVTIGGLVTDAANPFTFEVTAQDRANGYGTSNLIARGSTELLFGIATGGAASALGKGGKAAQVAGRGLAALDAGGNAYQATSGARDAYQKGAIDFQNGAQMIGGALGFAGNVAGAARKAANTAKALDEVVEEGATFAKPRVLAAPEFVIVNPEFVPKPTTLGKVGEALSGITKNTKTITINGRTRIPDGLSDHVLSEVKNVKKLGFTQQLRDYADFAKQNGLDFELHVPGQTARTGLSGPLKEAIENGDIILKIIPGL